MAGPAYLSAVRCTLLPQMLRSIPDEWKGTTFKNHALLGREGFTAKLHSLLQDKVHTGEAVTTQDLVNLGNAEDKVRRSKRDEFAFVIIFAMPSKFSDFMKAFLICEELNPFSNSKFSMLMLQLYFVCPPIESLMAPRFSISDISLSQFIFFSRLHVKKG